MKTKKILVIHGPNLQLLGSREPKVYGKATIMEVNARLKKDAAKRGYCLGISQTNHEGDIVDLIGESARKFSGILINPAAFTHTSIAIRDAISACGLPVVEVHLSNIYRREEFRQKSLVSPVAKGCIAGFGVNSYILGLHALIDLLEADHDLAHITP